MTKIIERNTTIPTRHSEIFSTAKDKGTGKEQSITISGSTNLDQSEIEKMVNEAEKYSEEDKRRRQEIEEINEAESLAYQVERQLNEFGETLDATDKGRIEQLVNDLKEAVKNNEPIDKLRNLKNELQQAAHTLSEKAYQNTSAGGDKQGGSEQTQQSGGDEDVVDADYEEQ